MRPYRKQIATAYNNQYRFPLQIIATSFLTGAIGGFGRAAWETINIHARIEDTITSPFLYAFLGGISAVVFVLGMGLDSAPWSRRIFTALLCGLFFFTVLNSGEAQLQLMQERNLVQEAITDVTEVTKKANSPAASSLAIEKLEDLALKKESVDSQQAAIDGVTEVSEATSNVDVKIKGIQTLVKIAVESNDLQVKKDIINSFKVVDYNYRPRLYAAIETGTAEIEESIARLEQNAVVE